MQNNFNIMLNIENDAFALKLGWQDCEVHSIQFFSPAVIRVNAQQTTENNTGCFLQKKEWITWYSQPLAGF